MPLSRLKRLLSLRQYQEAQREGERLIHSGSLAEEELAAAYKGTAVASYYLKEVYAAAKLGERALEVAERTRDCVLTNKCRYDLAVYYLTLGDYPEAYDHLLRLLSDLSNGPELPAVEAHAHHNLALIFRYRRQFDHALASHHLSADLYRRQGDTLRMMESLRGIIWCYLAREQPEEALPYLHQLEGELEAHPDDRIAASLLTDWAYYYQKTGDPRTSTTYCMRALSPKGAGVDEHILATASVIAGENALALGRFEEARIFANLAEEYALQARQPALMNRATALRRGLHQLGYASA